MDEDRGRSAERLVVFTDAVVAIAITLLALPLTEIGSEVAEAGFGTYLTTKAPQIVGFVISFFVIARLWWAHHRTFAHVVRWDGATVYLTVLWLFSVVLLAPATAIANTYRPDQNRGVVALYIGVMTVSSLLITVLCRHIRRHPELTDGRDTESYARLANSVETTVGFLIALVVGTAVPVVNFFALFVLVLTGRVGEAVVARHERRR